MLVAFDWDEHIQITEPKKADDLPLTGLGAFANQPKALAPAASDAPLNPVKAVSERDTVVSFDKVNSIPTETARDESSHPIVKAKVEVTQTNLPASQSFTFYTLAALAAIVGSITIGWMFLFGPKS